MTDQVHPPNPDEMQHRDVFDSTLGTIMFWFSALIYIYSLFYSLPTWMLAGGWGGGSTPPAYQVYATLTGAGFAAVGTIVAVTGLIFWLRRIIRLKDVLRTAWYFLAAQATLLAGVYVVMALAPASQ